MVIHVVCNKKQQTEGKGEFAVLLLKINTKLLSETANSAGVVKLNGKLILFISDSHFTSYPKMRKPTVLNHVSFKGQ